MADAKPFTDEEIRVLQMEFDGRDRTVGFQLTAERYRRFLATIAARDRHIEELGGKIDSDRTITLKFAVMTKKIADQAATIERLRGLLKRCASNMAGWPKLHSNMNDLKYDINKALESK